MILVTRMLALVLGFILIPTLIRDFLSFNILIKPITNY